MKPTLVTGATGFVGWHVARLLVERGCRVRALVRPSGSRGAGHRLVWPAGGRRREAIVCPTALHDLDAETFIGDLRDPESLSRAADGCGAVFHVAADYRLWAPDADQMYRSNVDGTRNLLQAARQAGVERVVYTSTVGCIGLRQGELGDEASPVSLADMEGPYKRSKFLAEQVALDHAKSGLDVVIVNPTAPVGGHDFKPTPTGKIILDFLRGAMPAFVDTGLNLVDVKDTAAGHLLALERGRTGERYILGCQNLTLEQILTILARVSGLRAPAMRIPYVLAYAAGAASTAWAGVTGREPRVPLDAVRLARKKMFVSHEKATRELGYAPGPVEDALRRAVEWFRANGYV